MNLDKTESPLTQIPPNPADGPNPRQELKNLKNVEWILIQRKTYFFCLRLLQFELGGQVLKDDIDIGPLGNLGNEKRPW